MKKTPPSYETPELRAFAEVLRGRRTIEFFLQTPVPRDLVREAVEAATWAPNHHVTEPWKFYSLGPGSIAKCVDLVEEIVAAKKGEKAGTFKANSWSEKPGCLIVSCRTSDDDLLQREDFAACAVAVQNFMLYLWKAGVGSKWTTGEITRDPRFASIIGFDESSESVVGLIWYGYAKVTPTQSRRDLDTVLKELP